MKRIVAAAGIAFFVASLSFAAPPDSAQYRAKVSPQITDQMSKIAGPIPAIVTLWDQDVTKPSLGELRFETNIDAWIAESDRAVGEVLQQTGIAPKARYHTFPGFAADLTPDQIERLTDSPLVRMISPDWKMDLHRKEGNALMNVTPVHALGKKGAGVSVAIVDVGVYWAHPELGGGTTFPNSLVVAGHDFIDNVDDPSPAVDTSTGEFQTHGTSVAGIIAGQGDPLTGATGVAPQAKIVAIRASSGSQVLSAYDYIATHATGQWYPPIKVVNMSFAFDSAGFYSSNCDSESGFEGFKSAFDRLNSLGIVLVASSGNEAKTSGVALPGCMSKVVAVGAVYDANIGGVSFGGDGACTDATTAADKVTCYSNSSSFVALLAPSHNCRTTKAGSGAPYNAEFGGTSAAAPYTSGAFAVIMAAFPGRTPEQYRDIFRSTGKSISDPKSGRSTPRIDLNAAYQALNGGSGTKSNIYIVPASARVAGSSAFFQTDVRIFNKTSTTANVDMFLLNAIDNGANTGVSFPVTGGQVRPIDDVIGQALGLGSGIGGLLFASDQPLVITSDTYALNTCPGVGGTLGQFIPAVAINKGGTSQRLYHVINDSRFYTNFGVVNTGTSQATINVTVKSGTGGTLGTPKPISLGAYGWTQVSKLLDNVGAGSTSNAYIDVTSNVPVIAYTSVVDRKTSDPFFVLGENQ